MLIFILNTLIVLRGICELFIVFFFFKRLKDIIRTYTFKSIQQILGQYIKNLF